MAVLIKVDRNGTKYYRGMVTCERCGGMGGHDKWAYTGWTCYECGGKGEVEGNWKEYTAEYEAKLQARREARYQKYLEEHAEEIARKEAERKAKEEEKRLEEERKAKEEAERKANSTYYGNVGDKIDIIVKYDHSAWWEQPSYAGYGTETMYLHCFRTQEGQLLAWKTATNNLGHWEDDEWIRFEEGKEIHLKGTIKEHKEYKDEKQTVLTRCRIS